MNKLDVEPTQIGSPSGYAPVRDVMHRNKATIRRNVAESGIPSVDLSEFLNCAGVGEVLSEIDPLHHGLGIYAATGAGLRRIINVIGEKLDSYGDSGEIPSEELAALAGMQIKALEALGETATNILTARSKLKTKPREGQQSGRITLEIRGAEPVEEKQAVIPV